LLGEEDHPSSKRQSPRLTETITVWESIGFDYGRSCISLDGRMIENSRGKDAIVTMDAGVLPGLSLRGYGESIFIEEDGQTIVEVQWLRLTGFDLVMGPAFHDAGITKIESEDNHMSTKADEKDKSKDKPLAENQVETITVARLREEHPDLVTNLLEHIRLEEKIKAEKAKELKEAEKQKLQTYIAQNETELRDALGLDETGDVTTAVREKTERLRRLEEAEVARQTAEYIQEQVTNLKNYPEWLRGDLLEAIKQREPGTVEKAKQVIVEQRKIFDNILANLKLRQKGFGLDILGPVLESETGVPEYARVAWEITESLRMAGHAKRRKLHEKDALTPSEVFAVRYLKRFDENYKTKLDEEAKRFLEAEQTTDLDLPYSVMRAIAEEAYPDLIASNVFDFGTMERSPDKIYFESQYVGEAGSAPSVTGSDNVNAAAFGTWYELSHKRIRFSGYSMEPSGGGTPFVYGTDYVIDFEDGRYMLLSSGSMATATNYDFDYTYDAVRKGENTEIERAKSQLANITLEALADRLALQITREAVIFSRSQLGWDAVTSSINLLIKELRRIIDQNLFNTALSQVLQVPNNIGGTWVSSSDSLQTLVEYIGNAKTKIENRFYMPTSVVMSKTRGNNLVLWDGFTTSGSRPGFVLNGAPGFLGEVHGLPVWTTTEIPDSHILVCHRELMQHRVFQAMQLFGPFPVYSSNGKLVAANEYYVEEFNGTISPLPEKGSVVVVS
jgi:hypothetical protein